MSYCGCVASLENMLKKCRIYDTQAKGIAAELGAYNAALAPLEELMEEVFGNFFILTADSGSLKEKECLIRSGSELQDEARRTFLLNYGRKDNFAMGNEENLLTLLGIDGEFTENYGGNPYALGLKINSVTGASETAAVERLRELLSLHLNLTLI